MRVTELIGADGVLKNPATEEKQDAIITAVNAISGTSATLLEKRELSAGSMIYKGQNTDAAAAEGDTDWTITKYTYDGDGNVTQKKILTGSWTGRAALSW